MAENKKGFILYSDIQSMVDKLPDEYAGKLFKHLLAYVNDEEPTTDDIILQIAFEPIKQSLKRDLNKWNDKINKRSEAGKIGANVRWQKQTIANDSKRIKPIAKIADSVNVNVSVNDKVKVKEKNEKEVLLDSWINYRKSTKKTLTKQSIDSILVKMENYTNEQCKFVINKSIEQGWQGLFWDNIQTIQEINEPKKWKAPWS